MKTKQIFVGNVPVGGGAPIAVQSMTNTDTRDAQATLAQIERLASAGCHIVRCTCLLYTSPSPRDLSTSRMPSSA